MITDDDFRNMRDKLAEVVREACSICAKPKIPKADLDLDNPDRCTCQCEKVASILNAMQGMTHVQEKVNGDEAKNAKDKAVKAMLRGEFKKALEWWRKSDVCTDACDDCPSDGTQCVGVLESYLRLSPIEEINEEHKRQFREWVNNGIKD